MSVPSPIPSRGADPGLPDADPMLSGWYLDKPATLRVSDPFLVVRADNAEVVFPRREFRFEVIGPSPTRPGTQQLMFIGDAVNVVFETSFDGGWERFIESVPPELVVTPEAAQLEAAGMPAPAAVGLRIGELDIEQASPPPPEGPMISRPDGSPVTVEIVTEIPSIPTEGPVQSEVELVSDVSRTDGPRTDVPRVVLALDTDVDADVDADVEPSVPNPSEPELSEPELFDFASVESDFVVPDPIDPDSFELDSVDPDSAESEFVESIARRDLELFDLDMQVEADLDDTVVEADLEDTVVEGEVEDLEVEIYPETEIDERDPAELDGLIDVDEVTDQHDPDALAASAERGSRLFGDASNERWHDEVSPTVRTVAGVVLPILRVVAPIVIVSRAIVRLSDGMTVLDRLVDLVLAVGVATLTVVAFGALLALVRPADDSGFSLVATLDERLTRSARRVGLSACVVAGTVLLMSILSPWLDRDITWPQAGWTLVATAAAFALSAACTTRASEVRARESEVRARESEVRARESEVRAKDSLDDTTMEEAR